MPPGKSVRVLYTPRPPNAFAGCRTFPQYVPTVNCLFPGWTVEVLTSLVEGTGSTISPIVVPEENTELGEEQENGSWTGLLGHLQNGSVDLICTTFQRTAAREKTFVYSYPLTYFQPLFVAKKKSLETASSIGHNFTPFDGYVWVCLGAVLVVYMVVFSLIAYCEHKMDLREKEEMYEMTWNTIAAQLLNYPGSLYFRTFGGKFALLVFSALSAGVIMYGYEGFVIFSILRPDKPFPYTEAEMLRRIADKSISVVTKGNGYWLSSYVNEAHGNFFDRLRQALQKNPLVFANSTEVKRMVSTGRYIFLTSEDDSTLLKIKQLCDVVTNPMSLTQVSTHLMFQRGSRLITVFNKEIIRQQKFIRRTHWKYFTSGFRLESRVQKCVREKKVDRSTIPMSFLDVQGILVLLGYGLAAALVVFLLELFFRRVHNLVKAYR